MFQFTKTRTDIFELLSDHEVSEKPFEFESFNDSMLSYYYDDGSYVHEIKIIADATFLKIMTAIELINQNNIEYFGYEVYAVETEKVIGKEWSIKK